MRRCLSFLWLPRGANRIPFRVLKSQGEDNMLDLSKMAHVFKNEPAPAKTLIRRNSAGKQASTANGSEGGTSLAINCKGRLVQSIAKPAQPQQREQVQEERQRQGLAPNQPLQATPAPRRAGNIPKQPAPARDSVTLQSLKTGNRQRPSRSAQAGEGRGVERGPFRVLSNCTDSEHHVNRGGAGDA